MDLDEILEREAQLKNTVKKNCMLCMGRSRLNRPKNPEKDETQAGLKELYRVYENKFNALRRADAEGSDIQQAGTNKRFVLDIISTCNSCDREVERASRAMPSLK